MWALSQLLNFATVVERATDKNVNNASLAASNKVFIDSQAFLFNLNFIYFYMSNTFSLIT